MNAPSAGSLRYVATVAAPVAAALVACMPAWADEEEEEIARLITPTSSVSLGLGWVSDENKRFGQYTGMNEDGGYLLFDLDVRRRSAAGTWLNARGRNLGLDSRELRLEYLRQGSWGTFIDFSQTPRTSPYTPLTGLVGYDTAQQVVGAGTTPLEIRTERRTLNAGFDVALGRGFDLQFRVRNEDKSGRRLFGRSRTGPGGMNFLVDPIDYNTQIFEATAGYTAERLQLSGGYVGTNFQNGKTRLDVTPVAGFSPLALPPGNESHQFHVGGGFGITPTTRMTFRVARGTQTQNEVFADTPAAAVTRTDLGGRVESTFGQLGISSRPLPALSLLANLRYDHRDDQTPVIDYFPTITSNTSTGENEPRSFRTRNAKAEATYRLPAGFSVTGGVEDEVRWRNTSSVRIVSFRDETDETTYRVDLRRAMSETLNGSIGFARSQRSGSEWRTTTVTSGANGSNLLHPLHLADRDRDKVRASLAWQATEALELNYLTEYSRDDYSGRTLGMRSGHARLHSLDAGLRISDAWSANAWVSYDDTIARLDSCASAAGSNTGNLSACPNTVTSPIWHAELRNIGKALGVGLRGKVSGPLEVGAELTYSEDEGQFYQQPRPATVRAVPDAHYSRSTIRLYGQYALTKRSGLRAQLVTDRFSTDDWTWTNWTYSDGTRVLRSPTERVDFLGLSGYFNF